jgi:preprotein translocase subunit SecY
MTFDIGAEPGSPSRALREPGLPQRIAITLGALLVAQLGTFIPLPGINPETVANLLNQSSSHLATLAWSHLSVFGLGMTPIFSALILAEVLMLINSSKRRLPVDLATRETFNRGILVAGLFFAALQAWGISLGLEGVSRTVDETGFMFRTSCIVSMVAATAFLSWLASLITRHGLGSGFWFLLLVPSLVGTIKCATSMKSAVDMGALPSDFLILPLAVFAALSVALVALERANPGLAQSGSTIWPLVLAATCASWLVIPALVYMNPNEMNGSISKLQPRHYVTFAAFAILVPVFSLWRMRSLKDANAGAAAVNTPLTIAGVLAAIMILTEYMIAKIGFYDLPVGEDQVTAVAVALCALQAIRASKIRSAPV